MGVVRLKESGRIYEDAFVSSNLDSKWEVLPNDATRYEAGSGDPGAQTWSRSAVYVL